jgi:hypothetical protein
MTPEQPDAVVMAAMRAAAERDAAVEIRSWHETEGANWRERLGAGVYEPSMEDLEKIDHEVETADRRHRHVYGRGLTDGEKNAVRMAAELRARPVFHSPTLNRADYDALGIGYDVPPERPNRGIAVKTGGGWVGDPAIVAKMPELEAQRRMRDAYLRETHRAARGVPDV